MVFNFLDHLNNFFPVPFYPPPIDFSLLISVWFFINIVPPIINLYDIKLYIRIKYLIFLIKIFYLNGLYGIIYEK